MNRAPVRFLATAVTIFALACCSSVTEDEREAAFDHSMRSSKWVIVDDRLIYYRSYAPLPKDAGSKARGGEAEPLLLLHGWNGSSFDYQALLDELPADIPALAPDLPGHGISAKEDIDYSMDFFVNFVGRFADALGIRRFALAGHSLGGHIAVHYAYEHPERVSRLILIDPDGLDGEEGSLEWYRSQGFLVDIFCAVSRNPLVSSGLRRKAFHDPSCASRSLLDPLVPTAISPNGIEAQRQIIKKVLGAEPIDAILPKLRLPVLILWGENDAVLDPKWSSRFVGAIPDARLVTLPECGHVPHFEHPAKVASLIAEFVKRTEPLRVNAEGASEMNLRTTAKGRTTPSPTSPF